MHNKREKLKAEDIITYSACHVSDGELCEGWRVGCDDLVIRNGAEAAVRVRGEEIKNVLISLIADDIPASSFQTTGQYRSWLIKSINTLIIN